MSRGALVLRLGAGHGQVGAELFTGRLSVSVVDQVAQPHQTAASAVTEAFWTAA